jgi:hypothetical protein
MPIPQIVRERAQALAGSISSHRILLYTLLSFLAVSAAIINALRNYSNFYSVAIFLSKSSRSVLVSQKEPPLSVPFRPTLDISQFWFPCRVVGGPCLAENILWHSPTQRDRGSSQLKSILTVIEILVSGCTIVSGISLQSLSSRSRFSGTNSTPLSLSCLVSCCSSSLFTGLRPTESNGFVLLGGTASFR